MKRQAKALFAVLLATLTFGTTAALALQTHPHVGTLDPSGVPNATDAFQIPSGVTVDRSNGEIWVYDVLGAPDSSGAVLRFDAATHTFQGYVDGSNTPQAGEGGLSFAEPADVAIDNSGGPSDGNLYVTDGGHNLIDAFDPATNELVAGFGNAGQLDGAGTPPGAFSSPCGLAVDQTNGDLYVADSGNNRIWVYDETGAYTGERIADSSLAGPCGLAFDSTGDLYVRNSTDGKVLRFDSVGPRKFEFGFALHPEGATDVTTDTADDHVFVSAGNQITEYDSSGAQLVTFGGADLAEPRGLAVDSSGGVADKSLYASDPGLANVHVFGALSTLPDVVTGDASAVSATAATLTGSLDPAGGPDVTSCAFEFATNESYEVEAAYDQSAPCEPAGTYSAPADVSADIAGLTAGTTYHYRLKVGSSNGQNAGEDRSFKTTAGPELLDLYASEVGEAEATINAELNPNGALTTYRFEYVAEKEFLANGFDNAIPVPTPDKSIGSGTDPVKVSAELSGLAKETAYRYRVLAFNSAGDLESDDRRLATIGPIGDFKLPDNRAWEMVSPPLKGGDVMGDPTKTRVASNGNAVQFSSLVAFGDAVGIGIHADYIARRTAAPGTNGWATHSITPPDQEPEVFTLAPAAPLYQGELSADLSSGVFRSNSPLTAAANAASIKNLYRRTDLLTPGYRSSSYDLLTNPVVPIPTPPFATYTSGYRPYFAGASADFSHIVFEAKENLTADAPPCAQFPSGDLSLCPQKLYEWEDAPGGGTLRLASILPDSACGSPPCVAPSAAAPRYDTPGIPRSIYRYTINTISADGSRIFFATGSEVEGDTALYMRENATTTTGIDVSEPGVAVPAGPAKFWGATPDGSAVFFSVSGTLFRYSADTPPDNHLTVIAEGSFEGVYGFSDDGETVYYHSDDTNLYAWRDGNATLVGHLRLQRRGVPQGGIYVLGAKESRVSPNGRYLLFPSITSVGLTGDDHGGSLCNKGRGLPCTQFYLYDAEGNDGAGELECVSCNRSGVRPFSDPTNMADRGISASPPTSHLSQSLADDGTVFFNSSERLVSEDTNGVQDVYEYDPHTGEQHLISSGESSSPSYFMGGPLGGHDVFFITNERLSGWDVDEAYDLYDARVDGGLPEPLPAPTSCQGDACQPPPLALNDPTPASSTYSGPGDPNSRVKKAPRCPKGKHRVKARGKTRCVKRKSAAKSRANHDRRASR